MRFNRGIAVLFGLAAGGIVLYLAISKSFFIHENKGVTGTNLGGKLVVSYRSEPQTFNRFVSPQPAEDLIARLTQATLIRLNRATGQIEPRLAREWTNSPDGLTWTFRLRDDVQFSDGVSFSSADVVFSFRALYDPAVKSEIASSLNVAGQPLTARALDSRTVVITFPAPYGPGISLLDALPILPAHKLQAALDGGTFRQAWGVNAKLEDLAGLGPFVIREYVPGQRLVFMRNPHFWRQDDHGRQLPYLDTLELQIVPDQNAEILRLQSGDIDLVPDPVRFEDLASLMNLQRQGRIVLTEAGVSIAPDMLWFNLDPAAEVASTRPWLQRDELRRAISYAVNRQTIVDTVFLGAAVPIFGPITPGHGAWYLPDLPRTDFNPSTATTLLKSIGLIDRNGDGLLDDERGQTARFSLLTPKGHTVRERTSAIIQEALRRVGLAVDVVPLERGSMIERWSKGDYDAIYFAISFDAFDPARNMEFWMSSGAFHFWHPAQVKPSTTWEARIDDLMTQQSTTLDQEKRRELFAEAQKEFAAHLPVLYFAAPKAVIAASSRVLGVVPSVLSPAVLWNAEAISMAPAASSR